MSAIVGWIAAPDRAPDSGAAVPMLEALAHRGAGGAGLFEFDNRGTRHRVVIAQRGPEPLYDQAARIALAFDGAIDNRASCARSWPCAATPSRAAPTRKCCCAATSTGTRTWSGSCAASSRFAIWDASKDRLLLARDRFGEKPLYLHERGGSLFFASEAKALLKLPGLGVAVDPGAVRDCLAYRYVPGPRTLFDGVRKLAPGHLFPVAVRPPARHALLVGPRPRPGREPRRRRSRWPASSGASTRCSSCSGAGPAGVFLSGGLDSAVLLALAAGMPPASATFSFGLAEERSRELTRAAALAKHFGTDAPRAGAARRTWSASLPKLVACRDAPIAVPSDLALYALRRRPRRSVRTVLTGEGGDEILGGYRRHVAERFAWGLRGFTGTLGLLAPLARSPGLATAVGDAAPATTGASAARAGWARSTRRRRNGSRR